MSEKVKLPRNIGKSIDIVRENFGKPSLYNVEWLNRNYAYTITHPETVQDAINNLVVYIRESDKNREMYFKALVNGYETARPLYFHELEIEEKDKFLNSIVESVKEYVYSDLTTTVSFDLETDTMPLRQGTFSLETNRHGSATFTIEFNGGVKR
ncbi:hypothetical protein ACU3L3_07210 [Priestia endophytica]